MNPATHKKIALRLLPAGWLCGFVDPAALRQPALLDVLPASGPLVRVPPEQIQAAYFLADFSHLGLLTHPEPRGQAPLPGVRMRCRTRDRFSLEGILACDLLTLAAGLDLTPLYARGAWQRVYVPAVALDHLQVLEVVRPVRRRRSPAAAGQITLFGDAEPRLEISTLESSQGEPRHAPR